MSKPSNDLLNADELAEILRMPRRWVLKHTASGHIPVAAKLGKMIRYRLDDVLAALKKETSMSE